MAGVLQEDSLKAPVRSAEAAQPSPAASLPQPRPLSKGSKAGLTRFTLEEMALITAAVLEKPGLNAADLARKLGRDRTVVARVVRKLRKAGGWYSPIVWKSCVVRGEPLATTTGTGGPKKVHALCRAEYGIDRQKRRWAAMSAEKRAASLARLTASKRQRTSRS